MTARTLIADQQGPIRVDAELTAGRIRVTAVPGLAHAEVTIRTADDEGPSHDAVKDAELTQAGGRLVAHVRDGGSVMASGGGSVNIVTGGASVAMVAGTVYGGIHQVVHGGQVSIGGRQVSTGRQVSASPIVIEARVPEGSRLDARTVSGDVHTGGRLATAVVHTTSASVDLDQVGEFTATTTSGGVTVGQLVGDGQARTVSGRIRVTGDKDARLIANSMSGDITATGGLGVTAYSVSGRVRNR